MRERGGEASHPGGEEAGQRLRERGESMSAGQMDEDEDDEGEEDRRSVLHWAQPAK